MAFWVWGVSAEFFLAEESFSVVEFRPGDSRGGEEKKKKFHKTGSERNTEHMKFPRHISLFLETEHVEGDQYSALQPGSMAKRWLIWKTHILEMEQPGAPVPAPVPQSSC